MMARALTRVLIAASLAWGVAPPALAQPSIDALVGQPVVDLRVTSRGAPWNDPQTSALLVIRPGQPLSMADVRETIAHLMSLGRFQDVRVQAVPAPGGVRVDLDLVPLRTIRRVVFQGRLGLPDDVLRAGVVDRFGPAPQEGRALDVARTLEELLTDHGYMRATVRPRPAGATTPDGSDMVFDVDSGAQAVIRTVIVRGSPPATVGALKSRLDLREGSPYEPVALRQRLETFVERLRRERYYEANAEPVAVVGADGAAVDLTIAVTRGPLVAIEFAGDALSARQRTDLVPVALEGSVDEDLLEDSERRIEDTLRAVGYRDARAPFTRSERDGRLRIVFTVRKGALYRLAHVSLPGATAIGEAELGLLVKAAPGQPLVQARLDADMAAITQRYRQEGYLAASVGAKTVLRNRASIDAEQLIDLALVVTEGPRTLVGRVSIERVPAEGRDAVPAAELASRLSSVFGRPFYAPAVEADRNQLLVEYLNRGFRLAHVEVEHTYSASREQVDLRFTAREGPQISVDHILIVGNDRISDATIRREIVLKPGEPLGLDKVNESQRRLAALGLFRRVTIAELQHGQQSLRDVLVTVEEAPATSLGYGGGVEFQKVETSEFAPRGFFEVGRRNLWGKNRTLSFFSRVSVRRRGDAAPLGVPASDGATAQTDLEYRVIGSYREPRFLNTGADLQLSSVFEQGSRTSFRYKRTSARLDLTERYSRGWNVIHQYSLERNEILEDRLTAADRPLIDRLFPQVRLSVFSTTAVRDSRADQIDPDGGTLLSLNGELALRPLGSEVGLAKTFLQAFMYRRLPVKRRVVFAAGARLGLGTGFPSTITPQDANFLAVCGDRESSETCQLRDLPASERFFAGGDTTVRGFELDRLGRPDTIDRNGTPKGGHAEVILNSELRLSAWRDLGVVGFLDAGNVFGVVNEINLGQLRAAAGFGLRYKSPVGPIRVDLGFKLGTLQMLGQQREHRVALHVSIGQAF
ncbi:MAG: POTRA domain-containing protein [Acidobacteriota bacterium]